MTHARMLALTLSLTAGTALAQPPAERESPPDRPREGLMDPEALASRLEKRLAESKKTQDQLQTAIDRLKGGATPADAMRDLDLLGRGMWNERSEGPRRTDGEMDPPDGPREGPGREGGRPGDGRRDGGGRGMGGPPQPMTDEAREWATTFLRTNLPTIATRMDALRQTDPNVADAMLGRLIPKLRDVERAQEKEPDLAKLRLDELRTGIYSLEAIRTFRKARELPASDATREGRVAEATKSLRAVLVEQHDVRLRLQAHEIQALTKRLDSLRAELERKQNAGNAQVDEMLKRITESGDGPDGAPLGRPDGRPEGGPPGEKRRKPD